MGQLWAVGVTTVPARRRDLLPRTLASLAAAGFPAPRLFVDGDQDPAGWAAEFGLEVTCRWPLVRAAGNWVLGLYELYYRRPEATRFAMFQDDVACVKNLRAYLDRLDYPDGPPAPGRPQPAYWNLYTSPNTRQACPDGHRGFFRSYQNGRGALALVFSRQAVITLLSAAHLAGRPCDPVWGWRKIDGGIVDSMRKAGWQELCHHPSLVLHTGVYSVMDKRRTASAHDPRHPAYRWPEHYSRTTFPGEDFDALSLLGAP